MTEVSAPPRKSRAQLRAEKERDRAALAALVDKVPHKVNVGGVIATRTWIKVNAKARSVARRGSLKAIQIALEALREWHETAP